MATIDFTKIETPCYVYDKDGLGKRLNQIKSMHSSLKIYYSAKANSNVELLKLMKKRVDGIDTASRGEIVKAFDAGFLSSEISYIGPGKSIEDLKFAIDKNIGVIVVESRQEIDRILSIKGNEKIKIQIRVNSSISTKNSSLTMAGHSSQFGIDEDQVESIINEYKDRIHIIGIHVYLRSQIFDLDELKSQFKHSISLSKSLQKKCNLEFTQTNIGGGFPIKYYGDQANISIEEIKTLICSLDLDQSIYTVEMGRFIIAPIGKFIAKVEYTKESYGKNFAILDGGFTVNSMIAGVGQIIKKNFNISTDSNGEVKEYELAGPSCTPFDRLASKVLLPKLSPGNHIVFDNCGAYGLSYSPVNFLELKRAKEFFI